LSRGFARVVGTVSLADLYWESFVGGIVYVIEGREIPLSGYHRDI